MSGLASTAQAGFPDRPAVLFVEPQPIGMRLQKRHTEQWPMQHLSPGVYTRKNHQPNRPDTP